MKRLCFTLSFIIFFFSPVFADTPIYPNCNYRMQANATQKTQHIQIPETNTLKLTSLQNTIKKATHQLEHIPYTDTLMDSIIEKFWGNERK